MKKETTLENETHKEIADWIRQLKFKKKIFGGVQEEDVWKKIEELNDLYERALLEERARYDTLLQQSRGCDAGNET